MENDYVILHMDAINLGDPFAGPALAGIERASQLPPQLRVDTASLNKREVNNLRRDPTVIGFAPPMPLKLIEPIDSETEEEAAVTEITWGLLATGAAESPYTGKGATVAVLDTGIDATHPAFAGVDLQQRDFSGDGDGDSNGHGTHVAGTIFGQEVNGFRFGVAPGVQRALIGKVLGDDGSGSSEWLYNALLWASGQGAHAINMSPWLRLPRASGEMGARWLAR